MARSFDRYHIRTSQIHLIASVFYVFKDKDYLLKIPQINLGGVAGIVRVISDPNQYKSYSSKDNNIDILSFTYADFVNHNQTIMSKIFGRVNISEQEFSKLNVKKFVFIFEDLDWYHLQLILKQNNIALSGGSTSIRQILSTVQYQLSNIIYQLGYTVDDVFNSGLFLKKYKGVARSDYSQEIDLGLFSNLLIKFYLEDKKKIEEQLRLLAVHIENRQNELSDKEKIGSIVLRDISKDSKKNKKINKLTDRIKFLRNDISSKEIGKLELHQNLRAVQKRIKNIEHGLYTLTELQTIYDKEFKLHKNYENIRNVLSNIDTRKD
jgi:hypothetical protein